MIRSRMLVSLHLLAVSTAIAQSNSEGRPSLPRPHSVPASHACDFDGFVATALRVQELRRSRLLTVPEFRVKAKQPNTVILDARAKAHFDALHIKGSINLPYTSFSLHTLRQTIPDTTTRILIYCRNNMSVPTQDGRASKSQDLDIGFAKGHTVGLNIPTAITLYAYGYHDVWELDAVLDIVDCPIELESTSANRVAPATHSRPTPVAEQRVAAESE